MSDEAAASNDEVVSVCFHYVDSKKNIKEVFLEFFDVGKINGGVIAKEILNFLVWKELPLTDCTGQCYDDFDRQLEKKGVV